MKPAALVDRDLKPPNMPRVVVTYTPRPDSHDRLVDLLVELLDARRRSRGG